KGKYCIFSMIQKIDNFVGKGEAESSNLSSSTILPQQFKKLRAYSSPTPCMLLTAFRSVVAS
ncbi:hypothetical protein, partial [Agrobacterium pusense]|uniref:hypothetical protein n=1 Tax=Agrobacterium pusense TaxID=648995 RepID=UPI00384C6842